MPSTGLTTREELITGIMIITATATITAPGGPRATIITARTVAHTIITGMIIIVTGMTAITGAATIIGTVTGGEAIIITAGKDPRGRPRANRRSISRRAGILTGSTA